MLVGLSITMLTSTCLRSFVEEAETVILVLALVGKFFAASKRFYYRKQKIQGFFYFQCQTMSFC